MLLSLLSGWATLPTKRVTYRAFDLTSRFAGSSPPQQLQVALGMCKYGYQGSFCVGAHAANGACKAFLLSLRITYSDGTERTIDSSATDGKWEATTAGNPIRVRFYSEFPRFSLVFHRCSI